MAVSVTKKRMTATVDLIILGLVLTHAVTSAEHGERLRRRNLVNYIYMYKMRPDSAFRIRS